jgi:hypothetical protein
VSTLKLHCPALFEDVDEQGLSFNQEISVKIPLQEAPKGLLT